MNNVTQKLSRLMKERGWTAYKLEQESGVPAHTIRRWFQSDMFPSIPILILVCEAFGITLAEFFTEGEIFELTSERKEHFEEWSKLSKPQREAVRVIIKSYLDS